MEKMCVRCGKRMEILDWFAYISTKYCKACKAERDRERKAAWARANRQSIREERDALRELSNEQRIMIEALREEIIRLRSDNRRGET